MSETAAHAFLKRNPLRTLLGMPAEYLDQAMALAYRAYQARSFDEAEIICRGLLAADPSYWWAYSLYAATLLKQGKPREALAQIDLGLGHEPDQPKLLAMKKDILTAAAAASVIAARPSPTASATSCENGVQ